MVHCRYRFGCAWLQNTSLDIGYDVVGVFVVDEEAASTICDNDPVVGVDGYANRSFKSDCVCELSLIHI